ncbi:MAG: DMT family transporter [Endozoicomonas sp.]
MPALVPVLTLVSVSVLAAVGWLLSKMAIDAMEPATFLAIRFFLAAMVLAVIFHKRLVKASLRDIRVSAAMGALMGVSMLMWVAGVLNTSHLGEGAFLVSLNIILIPVISRLLFGTRIPYALLLSLVPAIAGLAVLSLKNGFQFDTGQLYFFACATGLAFFMSLTPGYAQQVDTTVFTTVQLLAVSFVAFSAAFASETMTMPGTVDIWLVIVASALLTTSLRFILQMTAMARLSGFHAAMILMLEPVCTALLSWLVLNQTLALQQIVGCSLIFTAVVFYQFMSVRQHNKQKSETAQPSTPAESRG